MTSVGPRGLALIKRFESCRLVAYKDSGGIWTIGWGRTKGVHSTSACTQEQADKWLLEDLRRAEAAVETLINKPLTQSMFDALVSWTFNLGRGNLTHSTLRRRLNNAEYLECPAEIIRWFRTPGSELGLLRRRCAEACLFLEDGWP